MNLRTAFAGLVFPLMVAQNASAQLPTPPVPPEKYCSEKLEYIGVHKVEGEHIPFYTVVDSPGPGSALLLRTLKDMWVAGFICPSSGDNTITAYSRHNLSEMINDPSSMVEDVDMESVKKAYDDISNEFCTKDEYLWVEQNRMYYPSSGAACNFAG